MPLSDFFMVVYLTLKDALELGHLTDLCVFLKNITLVLHKTLFVPSHGKSVARLQTIKQATAVSPCIPQTEARPLEPVCSFRVWTLRSAIRSRPSRKVTAS